MGFLSDQPKAPLTTTTSIWPAAAVLITAILMLGMFMVINLIANQGVASTTTTTPVVVGAQKAAPISSALEFCTHNSVIPSNISSVFLVPNGTTTQSGANIPNVGAGAFDCYQPLVTPTNSSSLLDFYAAQLGARGWNLFSKGASSGAPQSLFQKAGADGFYWVAGITVNSSSDGAVHWTFRIYQNSQTI
jgi:hypothetical protein